MPLVLVIESTHRSMALWIFFEDKDKGAGFLLQRECNFFDSMINEPTRPFCAIVGGSKVSGKLEALSQLITKVDKLFIGGGMAFTFLRAKGISTGKSLVEEDLIPEAKKILDKALDRGVKVYLPLILSSPMSLAKKGSPKRSLTKRYPKMR